MSMKFDYCVIGSGPGGYVSAIRASRLGLRAAVVEKGLVGGVCTNTGCIPTKALLRSAEVFSLAKAAKAFGVETENVRANFEAMIGRKDRVAASLSRGIEGLLKNANVELIKGEGSLVAPNLIEVSGDKRDQLISADSVVIATGSSAAIPPIPGLRQKGVITSDGALELKSIPDRLVVIGGGAVGVEWASMFATLGSTVSIVEMQERLVPVEDEEVSEQLRKAFVAQGISVKSKAKVAGINGSPGNMKVEIHQNAESESIDCDLVLNATGRTPNTKGVGLETVGVSIGKSGVQVDGGMRTTTDGIYAIGDVTGLKLLAHVASHQGIVAAENAAGADQDMSLDTVPGATFCFPEIASVGLTEAQARDRYGSAIIGKFPYMASGRARAYGDAEGFTKVVAEPEHGAVVGVHIIGAMASDSIAEGVLAIKLEATLDDLRDVIHAHPTFPEALGEASWHAIGEPINTI